MMRRRLWYEGRGGGEGFASELARGKIGGWLAQVKNSVLWVAADVTHGCRQMKIGGERLQARQADWFTRKQPQQMVCAVQTGRSPVLFG